MPLYFGHKNTRGLAVSPALQSLKIDLLRAPPCAVNVIGRPTVTQPGYAAYVSHLPAFIKATNEQTKVPLTHQGYTTNFAIDKCLPLSVPSLVIDYGSVIPAKHAETLGKIGFERIKMQKNENIIRFPALTLDDVRIIKQTSPNTKTPAPAGAINLEALDAWVLSVRIISAFLTTHVYPAFRDDGHFMEEIEQMVDELMTGKRAAEETLENPVVKRARVSGEDAMEDEGEVQMQEDAPPPNEPVISLRYAKPSAKGVLAWGTAADIPNTSGLFFPYIPELASYDDTTIPRLFETYFLQSLGNTPEQQLDRYERIKSAWGIVSKTEIGGVMAHLGKVISLSLTSQGRCFPIIQDSIYQGSVLSGGRLFVGLNGTIYRPLSFEKLQEETGSYHLHSRVLRQIAEIVTGEDIEDDQPTEDQMKILNCSTMRELRSVMMDENLNESDRDEIRRLAVHLRFKNDNYLAVNPTTISRVLGALVTSDEAEDLSLPLHHSALFSRDKVLASLAAFGYQAPSFNVDNCPKLSLKESKPPTTLVMRQKVLDVATLDWKMMIESKEIRNNPRNLSRANRDRTIVANDKIVIWKKLGEVCGALQSTETPDREVGGVRIDTADGLDDW